MAKVKWTAIVLTCTCKEISQTLQQEMELRQSKGYIDNDVFLLTVEDPKVGVGSGGATLNALLTVAEYISAQKGYTMLNSEVLHDSYILILHYGRSYAYDSCGRPFTTLPAKFVDPDHDGLVCIIDLLFKQITEKIAVKSSPGVWVSSLDMVLTIPYEAEILWESCDVCAVTVPSLQYSPYHGVYKLDSQGYVEDILYRETIEKMELCRRQDGSLPVVCGLVYFSATVSETLLSFYTKPPLDACTYFGMDLGEHPIMLSLFFDVMLPMCSHVDARDFRSGARCSSYGKNVPVGAIKTMRMARTILWEDLNKYRIKACMIEDGTCVYPHNIIQHRRNIMDWSLQQCFPDGTLDWNNLTHAHIKNVNGVDPSAVVINSVVEENVSIGWKCVLTHCHIRGNVSIAKDSYISGLITNSEFSESITFAESMIIQCYHVYIKVLDHSMYVMTTHGRFDDVEAPMWKTTSTYCNDPWVYMLNRTSIVKEDLWGQDVDITEQNIYTAQLFPVFHPYEKVGLQEILWLQGVVSDNDSKDMLKRWRNSWRLSLKDIQTLTDLKEELESRRRLFYTVGEHEIAQVFTQHENRGFHSLYNAAVVDGYTSVLLHTLDTVCKESCDQIQAGTAARTLANIADVLGCMAGPKGGLRSGPAANKTWALAFQLLEEHDIKGGVEALAKERDQWLDRPDRLIRAARHYEGAAQILIRHAVMTAKKYFKFEEDLLVPFGHWVLAECPARIDVSGGWSDTPPITYEHGGAVVMVGLLVDNKRPIGAKARRVKEPHLLLVIHGSDDKSVVCHTLADLSDYCSPHSPGALLKAAFVCAEIVDITSKLPLKDQLMTKYQGGFELHSWSNLPHGSGLGTSSILAGAVMAALLKAAGRSCDTQGLIHAVLYLEQLLTTGGGWQDQIGGLCGGVKLGISDSRLPLFVDVVDLSLDTDTLSAFNDRLVLIYTGKTRLARNLLQDVVRNWYARNAQIVETEDKLVTLANNCAKYFKEGNLMLVGECMDEYWKMKKLMAPGCEPEVVSKIMYALRNHALGMCMAGAGGGGFMYVLAKDQYSQIAMKSALADMQVSDGVKVYDACIDQQGLQITIIKDDEESLSPSELGNDTIKTTAERCDNIAIATVETIDRPPDINFNREGTSETHADISIDREGTSERAADINIDRKTTIDNVDNSNKDQ